MKILGMIAIAVLCLTLGAAPLYALQEQQDRQEDQKAKPARQEQQKTQQPKPARQAEKPAAQPSNNAKQEKPSAQRAQSARQQKPVPQQNNQSARQQKPAPQQDNNARQGQAAEQPQQQHTQQPGQQAQKAGGNRGGRIPDDRYRANFGRQHTFRVSQGDYSNRRFQYGGYSFGFVGPWPSNWLYTQDVFVVDIDGVYYLCNPMYPGVNIALSVVL